MRVSSCTTVELQRIERLVGVLGLGQARLHLGLGLQLDVAQLQTQPVQVAGQIFERPAQGDQFALHPGARDHDLTGLVHQAVKQLGPDPDRCTGAGSQGSRYRQGRQLQGCRRRQLRCCVGCRRLGIGRCHVGGFRPDIGRQQFGRGAHDVLRGQVGVPQHLEAGADGIEGMLQGLDIGAAPHFAAQAFCLRFHAVHHLAQTQRTGQTGTALECVQVAQHLAAGTGVVRSGNPLAQSSAQLRQKFGGLVGKDREEVGIDGVEDVDVVIDVLHMAGLNTLERARQRCEHGVSVGCVRRQRLGRQVVGHSALAQVGPARADADIGFSQGFVNRSVGGQIVHHMVQSVHQFGIWLLEETGSELVQQTSDVFGSIDKQAGLRLGGRDAIELVLGHGAQRVFERTGNA
jgi:hypothetical protein